MFKLTCMAGELARALSLASQVAGREKQIPILRAVRIAVTPTSATISATNNDHGASVTIAAKGEGVVYVEAALLAPKAAVLRHDKPVDMSLSEGVLTAQQGKTRYRVPVMPDTGFPVAMTEPVAGEPVTATAGPFLHALSIAPDAIWPGIASVWDMGALLDMGDEKFRIVSTNKKIMSIIELDMPRLPIAEIILPLSAMSSIRAMFKEADNLEIVATRDALSVSADGLVYRTKLIEGKFLPWRQVAAGLAKLECAATIPAALATETLSRATAIAEEKRKDETVLDVRVNIAKGELTAKAKNRSAEDGEDACEVEGDDGEFIVGATYFRKMLGNIGTRDARLDYAPKYDPDMPVVIRAWPSERENYRIVSQVRAAK